MTGGSFLSFCCWKFCCWKFCWDKHFHQCSVKKDKNRVVIIGSIHPSILPSIHPKKLISNSSYFLHERRPTDWFWQRQTASQKEVKNIDRWRKKNKNVGEWQEWNWRKLETDVRQKLSVTEMRWWHTANAYLHKMIDDRIRNQLMICCFLLAGRKKIMNVGHD